MGTVMSHNYNGAHDAVSAHEPVEIFDSQNMTIILAVMT
jgi:hypothetical protein